MATAYILYNEKAGTPDSFESVQALELFTDDEVKYIEVTHITNYDVLLSGLGKEDYVILAGGDGTLNWFINRTDGVEIHNEILYFPNGTGNDFAHDVGHEKGCLPFSITEYIKNLPSVSVKGKKYRFINGVGFGIDGYCCEVGDTRKKISRKKVNYTLIAIKGLLFHYKPTNAKVTVDGKTYTYKNVWIAPTMHGRYYGGGMMPTPNQKRNSGMLSTMIFHNAGKLKTLMIFPSLFKGEHTRHTKHVDILEGKEITVEFDRPTSLQIDGETILSVTVYTATARKTTALKEFAV